jgi:hypothetical protein
MEQLTVNSIMLKLSTEVIDQPDELSKYLIFVTANLWKYGKEVIDKEVIYAKKWQELRMGLETDGQANIRIKTTKEYHDWQMEKVTEKCLLEMIRAIKKRLQSLNDEFKSY